MLMHRTKQPKLLFTRFYMEKLKTTWIEKVNKYISGEKKSFTHKEEKFFPHFATHITQPKKMFSLGFTPFHKWNFCGSVYDQHVLSSLCRASSRKSLWTPTRSTPSSCSGRTWSRRALRWTPCWSKTSWRSFTPTARKCSAEWLASTTASSTDARSVPHRQTSTYISSFLSGA